MRIKSYYEGTMDERQRILQEVDEIEKQSHATRTPIFQDTLFQLVREAIVRQHPPQRFRDTANGE